MWPSYFMNGCVSNNRKDVDVLRKLTCFFKLWPIGDFLLYYRLPISGRSPIGPNSHQWDGWSMANISGRFVIGHKSRNMFTSWVYLQLSGQLIKGISRSRTPTSLFLNTQEVAILNYLILWFLAAKFLIFQSFNSFITLGEILFDPFSKHYWTLPICSSSNSS